MFALTIFGLLELWVFTVLSAGTAATLFQNNVVNSVLGIINGIVGAIRVQVPI